MTDCYEAGDTLPRHREINLPLEIKPVQVKASFRGGIQEVQLPKLVVVNAAGDDGVEGGQINFFNLFFCINANISIGDAAISS